MFFFFVLFIFVVVWLPIPKLKTENDEIHRKIQSNLLYNEAAVAAAGRAA